MGPSWEGKSSQDRPRQAKTGQDKGSEGKGRERKRKGRDWKGKVWKSVDADFLRAGGGFSPTLRGIPPRALDPLPPVTLEPLNCDFLPTWRPSFFHRFFDAFFDRSWLDFRCQLASQNPPKSMKHRSQDGKASWHRFFIDFGGFWEASWHRKPNQDPYKKALKTR